MGKYFDYFKELIWANIESLKTTLKSFKIIDRKNGLVLSRDGIN